MTPAMFLRLALGLSLLALSVENRPSPRWAAPGLVIVTLDTIRADRLSTYGFSDAAFPAIERLAREGIVFDRASTVVPLTLPAHCSIFTALLPLQHGVRDNGDSALAESHTTLAEILRAKGFRTGAFVGAEVLASDRGLAQGYDVYGDAATAGAVGPARFQRRGDAVASDAIAWLAAVPQSAPFFLWIHLYDPHRPYDPPEPFRSRHVDPYVGEIAFADSQIGRVLEALERRGRFDRTIVVVAGDHGESLGDHGERDHGTLVYESVLRVPLIMRVPYVSPQRVSDLVRVTDIMPTALALLGVAAPSGLTLPLYRGLNGVSLAGLITRSGRPLDLESYSESLYPQRFGSRGLRSVRDRRFKFIDAPEPELYDLNRDPFEERNIYDERPALAAALQRRLAELIRVDVASNSAAEQRSRVPLEIRQRLQSLGYVAASVGLSGTEHRFALDPRK
jgi:arylsulfatase A-like enzyme